MTGRPAPHTFTTNLYGHPLLLDRYGSPRCVCTNSLLQHAHSAFKLAPAISQPGARTMALTTVRQVIKDGHE